MQNDEVEGICGVGMLKEISGVRMRSNIADLRMEQNDAGDGARPLRREVSATLWDQGMVKLR
jgi:hypothetical protein